MALNFIQYGAKKMIEASKIVEIWVDDHNTLCFSTVVELRHTVDPKHARLFLQQIDAIQSNITPVTELLNK